MVSKYVVEKAVSGICVILTVARQSGYAGLNFEGPDDQHWRWCRLIVRLVMSLNLREIIKEIGDTKYPIVYQVYEGDSLTKMITMGRRAWPAV